MLKITAGSGSDDVYIMEGEHTCHVEDKAGT